MIAVDQKITPVFDKTIIMEGSWYERPRIIGSGVAYITYFFTSLFRIFISEYSKNSSKLNGIALKI
jgi:hypothetical protein